MEQVIFIVGVGRSGTTLLQSMLNAHPEICFTPETHFLKKFLVPALRRNKSVTVHIAEKLKADPGLARTGMDIERLVQEHMEQEASPGFASFFRQVLEAYGKAQNKSRVGDKDPLNIEYLPHIRKAFPEAYVIHIIRDPRDVMLSRLRSDWGRRRPLLAHICEYQAHLEKARREGEALFKECYLEVSYEDLVNDPEIILQKLCKGLGVAYDEQMLQYQEKARALVKEGEEQWKGNVFKPVQKGNVGKWKEGLKPHQVRTIEAALEPTMQRTGYIPVSGGRRWSRLLTALPLWLCRMAFALKSRQQRAE